MNAKLSNALLSDLSRNVFNKIKIFCDVQEHYGPDAILVEKCGNFLFNDAINNSEALIYFDHHFDFYSADRVNSYLLNLDYSKELNGIINSLQDLEFENCRAADYLMQKLGSELNLSSFITLSVLSETDYQTDKITGQKLLEVLQEPLFSDTLAFIKIIKRFIGRVDVTPELYHFAHFNFAILEQRLVDKKFENPIEPYHTKLLEAKEHLKFAFEKSRIAAEIPPRPALPVKKI